MGLNKENSIAELRSELDRKRMRTLDLRLRTTDPVESQNLNALRWELEDLDNDLYRSQFIRNNDLIEKLIGQIEEAGEAVQRVSATLAEVRETLARARAELAETSVMFSELQNFYTETEELLDVFRI